MSVLLKPIAILMIFLCPFLSFADEIETLHFMWSDANEELVSFDPEGLRVHYESPSLFYTVEAYSFNYTDDARNTMIPVQVPQGSLVRKNTVPTDEFQYFFWSLPGLPDEDGLPLDFGDVANTGVVSYIRPIKLEDIQISVTDLGELAEHFVEASPKFQLESDVGGSAVSLSPGSTQVVYKKEGESFYKFVGVGDDEVYIEVFIPLSSNPKFLRNTSVQLLHRHGSLEWLEARLLSKNTSGARKEVLCNRFTYCHVESDGSFTLHHREEENREEQESYVDYSLGFPVVTMVLPSYYVCIQDGGLNVYDDIEDVENSTVKLASGVPVKLVHNQGVQTREKNGRDYDFIQIEVDGQVYWAADNFIKTYDECEHFNPDPQMICASGSTVNARDFTLDNVLESFTPGQTVYRYDHPEVARRIKKVGQTWYPFVPIQKQVENTDEIFWVASHLVKPPYDCANSSNVTVEKCGGQMVNLGDEYPHDFRAYRSYRARPARFGNSRRGGRLHAATDLYPEAFTKRGRGVHAINDGVIIDVSGFYCETHEIVVRSAGGYLFRYGEVAYNRDLYVGKPVSKGDYLADTKHVGRCAWSYPSMLHLEKYARGNWGISGRGGTSLTVYRGRYQRRSDLQNPTCHVQFMESKKFGVSH